MRLRIIVPFSMFTLRQRRHKQLKQFCCMLCAIFAMILFINRFYQTQITYMPLRPKELENYNFSKYVTIYQQNLWKNTTLKRILVWTPFFGSWDKGWVPVMHDTMTRCPAKCIVTANKMELESSDAIYFHAGDLWHNKGLLATLYQKNIEMPAKRRPDQVWVLFSMEPLIYMWGMIPPYIINWTVYYRRESTIFAPFKIGVDVPFKEKLSKRDYFSEKSKFASTLVSNCEDQAQRYRIIYELKKYIDLDDFGSCSGRIICPAGIPAYDCGVKYLSEYKFYIAFENSFCRDYISEKFWNALARRQIPVIAAPRYNTELLPPKSYLNVFDFPSIEDLANRMIEIGNNQKLYNSYFEWIANYEPNLIPLHCKLCIALHANMTPQSYNDIDAWLNNDICHRSSFFSLVTGYLSRLLFDLGTGWF